MPDSETLCHTKWDCKYHVGPAGAYEQICAALHIRSYVGPVAL